LVSFDPRRREALKAAALAALAGGAGAAGVAHAVPARGNAGTGAGASAAAGAAAPSTGAAGAGWDGLQLWYPRPATQWVEALPLGNGRLGAMVWGGGKHERIQLNEDTLYAGGP